MVECESARVGWGDCNSCKHTLKDYQLPLLEGLPVWVRILVYSICQASHTDPLFTHPSQPYFKVRLVLFSSALLWTRSSMLI